MTSQIHNDFRPEQDTPHILLYENLAKSLFVNHEFNKVTDLIIHSDGTVQFRKMKNLIPGSNLAGLTDENGKLKNGWNFGYVAKAIYKGDPHMGTVMARDKNFQIRSQYLPSPESRKLIIRVQRKQPPDLNHILGHSPKTVEALSDTSGLILVVGPIGGGKTTTAAAICQHWADKRTRHIATLEDPVEYLIRGTQLDVRMHENDKKADTLTLSDAIRLIRRASIDGLFIGEIRDLKTRDECLDFGASQEPVITTMHANSLDSALVRLIRTSPEGYSEPALRLLLSNVISMILHVAIAYTKDGFPVPVVTALNVRANKSAQNMLADLNPKTLAATLDSAFRNAVPGDGTISVRDACIAAKKKGATIETIQNAIPPEMKPLDWAFLQST